MCMPASPMQLRRKTSAGAFDMRMEKIYSWEHLPVYDAANQLARVIGAYLTTVQRRQRRVWHELTQLAMQICMGISGANAELPLEEEIGLSERRFRLKLGLEAVHKMRKRFTDLRAAGNGDVHHIGAALELLERIESSMNENLAELKEGYDSVEYCIRASNGRFDPSTRTKWP